MCKNSTKIVTTTKEGSRKTPHICETCERKKMSRDKCKKTLHYTKLPISLRNFTIIMIYEVNYHHHTHTYNIRVGHTIILLGKEGNAIFLKSSKYTNLEIINSKQCGQTLSYT